MKLYKNKDWLNKKYCDENLPASSIAIFCGSKKNTIYYWLEKYHIEIRNVSERQRGELNHRFGKKTPDEHRVKLSIANMGHIVTRETRRKISKAKHGKNYGMYGEKHPNFGKKLNLNERKQISKNLLGNKNALNHRLSNETRLRIKKQCKKWHKNNAHPMLGKNHSEKSIKLMSTIHKKLWGNTLYVKKTLNGTSKRPSSIEKFFDKLTPDSIRYVGNRTWWRKLPNGKYSNPDFKITGQNKVIFIHGNYWHRGENTQELINLYKQIDIDCLIFWENEIYDNPKYVLDKVNNFIF